MRLYTVINGVRVWNLNGELLPIIAGGMGGGGGGSTVVNTPPPTAEETELSKINLKTAKQQAQQFTIASAMNDPTGALGFLNDPAAAAGQFEGLRDFDTPAFRAQLQQQLDTNATNQEISTLVNRRLIEQITGKAQLSPDEKANLDTMYGAAQTKGETDLKRFLQESAAMRGLNVSDSPVISEGARAAGEMNLGLQSARAASELSLGDTSKNFNQSVSEFQTNLNQQNQQTRLGLSQAQGGVGIGMQNAMLSARQGAAGKTTSGGKTDWMPLAGAGVAAAGMVAAAAI